MEESEQNKKPKKENMDSQEEPTKPKRLKFSRLCLSQNRNTASAPAPATTVLAR